MKSLSIIAYVLASILVLSVVSSNAYGLALSPKGLEENLFASIPQQAEDDDDDEDDRGKGKGKDRNNSGRDSDDDEEKGKGKGKDIKIKVKKGGKGQVTEVEDGESSSSQQSQSAEQSLLFPVDFTLKANDGIAVAKGKGIGSSRQDASINLNATTVRFEGNHVRVVVEGIITVGNDKYVLTDGKGIIIFFNHPGKQFFSGIVHITGKIEDDNGKMQKFHLRAYLLPPLAGEEVEGTWAFVVMPAAKVGPHIRLVHLSGELTRIDNGSSPPPVVNKKLDRFAVSIPTSPITAGAIFNVTITALDSDDKVLKSYRGIANITDLTGSVKPAVASNFVDGVFKGQLNITKSMKSNKLTITDISTGKKGTSNAFDVKPAALAIVDLTPSTATIPPGGKASFTAKALDKFGNEIPPSEFTFAWSLSSANFGAISVISNKANFTASASITTETNVTLTAAIGALSDSSKITIKPAPAPTLDHFVITSISSPKTAGSPFAISITAISLNGSTLTSYAGPIKISDTTGTLSVTTNNGFSSGIWTGSVNITKAASAVQIKVQENADASKNGTSNTFEVRHGNLDHFKVSNIANQTAGVEFAFNVTAQDAYGNIVTGFNGNVTLFTNVGTSPAGNVSQISPSQYTFNSADQGVHTFKAKLFNATKDAKITVTSKDGKTGSSNNFDVVPGAIDKISVTPSDVSLSLSQNVTFTAQARDAFGNVIGDANFNWDLSSPSLGSLNTSTGNTVKFTATASAATTISGAITATSGAKSGTATIQVSP
jgi:hypothetical protein